MDEKEYIERGALIAKLAKLEREYAYADGSDLYPFVYGTLTGVRQSTIYVMAVPAADVVEVRYGEWVEHFGFDCWHYDCPFCDDGYATQQRDETPPNYCSNCGARLTLESKEQT